MLKVISKSDYKEDRKDNEEVAKENALNTVP
jgi:hypothetical protein